VPTPDARSVELDSRSLALVFISVTGLRLLFYSSHDSIFSRFLFA